MPSFTGTLIEDDAPQAAGPMFGGTLVEEPSAPVVQAVPAVAASPKSWGETAADVGRSIGGGLSKGVAGLAGFPADLGTIAVNQKDKVDAYLTGRDPSALTAERNAKAMVQPDTVAQYGGDALNKAYGYDYAPQTTTGKFADSVASFVPGALLGPGSVMRRFALGAGVPGLASEAAGEATAGTAAEPYARIAAALASPAIASRAVTPIGVSAARAPQIATLEQEGIPLTAGQRTGNKSLQFMESTVGEMPFAGGGYERAMEAQRQGLNRAMGGRFGENADMLSPDVMQGASRRIGGVFDEVQNRNALQFDPQMGQDMADTIARYGRKLPSQQREPFGNAVQDIRDQVIAGGGAIPGPVYQQARSDLTKIVQGARTSDPAYAGAMGGIRDALDSAFERSIAGTQDAGRLAEARRQYAAMKTTEKAIGGAGVEAAQGNVSPSLLRSAVAGQDKAAYVRGQGDLADLAHAAPILAPLPNSGTNPRSMATSLVTALGAAGTGLAMHAPNEQALLAGLGGIFAPALAGRAIMSTPVQRYLGNNALAPMGGGASSAGARVLQGYENSAADPLTLRMQPRR